MMKKRGLSKRILAFMLSLMMVIALVPMNAITVKAEGVPNCPHCGGTGLVCSKHAEIAHARRDYSNINSCKSPCKDSEMGGCGSHMPPLTSECDYCKRVSACKHSSATSYNDADFHGKTCDDCGAIIDKESHTDINNDGICDTCRYSSSNVVILPENNNDEFKLNICNIPSEGGRTYCENMPLSYSRGTSATFTAKPNSGYRFKGWYAMKSSNASGELGTCLSSEETYKITPSAVDTYKECEYVGKNTYSVFIAAVYEDSTVHTHSKGTYHEAASSTCIAAGNIEYWDCRLCEAKIDVNEKVIEDITIPRKKVITSAIDTNSNGFEGEGCENLLDSNTDTKWCCSFDGETFVVIKASEPVIISSYTITTAGDTSQYKARNPKSWTLLACNDYNEAEKKGTWEEIDSISNGDMPNENTTAKIFNISSTKKYQYYKWNVTSIVGGSTLQVSEFELYALHSFENNDANTHKCSFCNTTGEHDFSDGTCKGVCTVCGASNTSGTHDLEDEIVITVNIDRKEHHLKYDDELDSYFCQDEGCDAEFEPGYYNAYGSCEEDSDDLAYVLLANKEYSDQNIEYDGCLQLQVVDFRNIEGIEEFIEFKDCKLLQTVNLGRLQKIKNTENAIVFDKCQSLQTVDLGSLKYCGGMIFFENCPSLQSVDLKNLTEAVSWNGLGILFNECGSLETIDLGSLKNAGGYLGFYDCDSLRVVDLGKLVNCGDVYYDSAEAASVTLHEGDPCGIKTDFEGCVISYTSHTYILDEEGHYVCSVCGHEGGCATGNHDFFDGKCTVCNYECTHTGGTAICQEKKICTLCGELYGDLVEHDFVNNGDGTHKCTRCDERESHNYDGYYVEDTCHTKMCSACGMTNSRVYGKPYHTYGEWIDGMRSCICGKTEICTHNEETTGICSICHKDLDHIHTVDTYHEAKGASCVDGNIEYWDCTCGLKFDANDKVISDVTIPATGPHDFSDEGICKICNCECTHQNDEGWTVEDGKCTSCGVEIGYPVDDDDKPVVVNKVPDQLWVTGIKQNLIYTGAKVEQPTMKVYWKNKLLVLNQDYTVKYLNNIKAGTATVVITGKGNYAGTIKETYPIEQIDIGLANAFDEEITIAANGKAQKPTTTFTIEAGGKTVTLKNGTDYTYTYPVIKDKDEYDVTITGKGNYKGTKTVKVIVVDKGVAVTKLTVKKIPNQIYRDEDKDGKGDQIVPDVVVMYGKKTLDKGTDYTVEAAGANTDIGTGTVTIVGNSENGYYGKRNIAFNIVGTPITKATVEGLVAETYTGNAINPAGYKLYIKATKTTGQIDLTENKDYKVSVDKNVNAGTATVTFTGINGYSGVLKKTFKINKASMTDERISIKPIDAAQYQKNGAKPAITVIDGSKVLKENVDYTVKYTNNNALHDLSNEVKKPTVTITGKGNYVGTKSANFAIIGSSLSKDDITITATDIVASGKANTCKPVIKLTDNGVALKAGTDYETAVEYTYVNVTKVKQIVNRVETEVEYAEGAKVDAADIIPAGTEIKATVKGKGLYADSAEVNFRYVAANIASAKVVIPNFVYTKKAITLDESKIQVTMVVNKKAETLKFGEDFEIIGYKNNVNKGTAKVTIRGLGNYGGTKEVAFKIVSKTLNHTVRLHNNDGSGKDVVKEVGITSGAMLPANTFKVTGKKFIGWNTKADGSGESYSDREAIIVRNYLSMLIFGDTLDLYAQWE